MIEMLPSLVVLGTSLWVLVDSRSMGLKKGAIKGFFNMGPTGWFLSCLLCWIVAFPAYLVKRQEYKRALAEKPDIGARSAVQPATDLMSQLAALSDDYSQGLVSDEEFRTRKRDLVQRMLNEPEDVGRGGDREPAKAKLG